MTDHGNRPNYNFEHRIDLIVRLLKWLSGPDAPPMSARTAAGIVLDADFRMLLEGEEDVT